MYYRLKKMSFDTDTGGNHAGRKYQDQLLHLERIQRVAVLRADGSRVKKKDSYVEYTLLYDTIASRISIEVEAKDGKLRLMKNVWWEYDKPSYVDCWWYRWR